MNESALRSSMPLDELGNLRSGYVARVGLVECAGSSHVRALQSRDVSSDGNIAWPSLRCVQDVPDRDRHRIRDGDLLVPLRATKITAIVPEHVPENVIAVGHWGILTPDPTRVDARYVAWYLNHPATAPRVQAAMSGTSLPFLSMSALREFEIELVPLERQRHIARVAELHTRTIKLEARLAYARQRLLDHITLAALQSEPSRTTEKA